MHSCIIGECLIIDTAADVLNRNIEIVIAPECFVTDGKYRLRKNNRVNRIVLKRMSTDHGYTIGNNELVNVKSIEW